MFSLSVAGLGLFVPESEGTAGDCDGQGEISEIAKNASPKNARLGFEMSMAKP
jgi:hypothetical protein